MHKMSKKTKNKTKQKKTPDKYFFTSSLNVPVRETDVILYDVAAKMCQFDVTSVINVPTLCGASIALFLKQKLNICNIKGVQCKRRLEFLKVVDVIQDF